MKVLILNGSPKNEQSNTLNLTNSFLDGMKEYGAIEEEYIHVSQKDMKPCLGCFCWLEPKTPGQCVYHDDMKEMIPKLLEADVIIWSFPALLFWYAIRNQSIYGSHASYEFTVYERKRGWRFSTSATLSTNDTGKTCFNLHMRFSFQTK